MANISEYLKNILSARYGRDVRQSIHDGINAINDEVAADKDEVVASMDAAAKSASEAKQSATDASNSATKASEYAIQSQASAEEAKSRAEQALSTTPDGYNQMVSDVDLLKNSIIQTTDRTLYGSKEGGIKLIGIKGASEQKRYSGKNLLNLSVNPLLKSGATAEYNEPILTLTKTSSGLNDFCMYLIDTVENLANETIYAKGTYSYSGGAGRIALGYADADGTNRTLVTIEDAIYGEFATSLAVDADGYAGKVVAIWIYADTKQAGAVGDIGTYSNVMVSTEENAEYEPYVGATQSPNPIYQQEVESSGDIKNLLKYPYARTSETINGITVTDNGDGTLTFNGTATATVYYNVQYRTEYTINKGKYIMNGCPSGGASGKYEMYAFGSNGAVFGGYDRGSGVEFEIASDNTEMGITIAIGNGVTVENLVFKPMIRKASVKNAEYKPYGYSLGIKEKGKNKFTGWVIGQRIDSANGSFVNDINGCRSDLIEIDATKEYFLSNVICTDGAVGMGFFAYYDENKNFISRTGAKIHTDKVLDEVPTNAKYVAISCYYNADTAPNFAPSKISHEVQLEEGTVATPYEPYRSKSITIPLNEPLRGIREVKDEVICKDGVWGVLRRIGSYTFDGTETSIMTGTGTSGKYRFANQTVLRNMINLSNRKIFTTHYIGKNDASSTWSCIQSAGVDSSGNLFFYDEVRNTSDVSIFNAWLSENPVTVEYILATPIFEPFTDQTPFYGLESFDTVTYISTDSKVEPSIELKFAKTEGDAINLGNYNRTKLNEIHISEMMALQTELAAAVVAGSEG